ncbi:restriction endonuclease subunit S [Lacticaseibacillus paracasei]|uniref:restriction endonuclease subunit S n=1 Tax=Lacticaseibacillus paracasei TaxID=1597 RepID=UPI0021A25EDC|nr:restriction endonuclease subunit S [Lacticaseibacillus paracasei]MCT3317787.1 restriction endonuclease subunit S [Lacticaseibacillus paracasei]
MSKDAKNVPALRFKGYSDAWEKRKLGDLGSVAMNKRIYKDQTSDEGEIPFYKIGSFGKQADAFISRKLFNEYKKLYPFPKKGDILISASGSIGRTIVYNGEDAYFQDSNIIWIQHDNRLDNTFLHQLFNIIRWSGVEGTTIKRLYNKNILSTQILLPSVEEQRSIGNLLDNVDNLIAATQHNIDALEQAKKALLQRLFDQSWRFKGYSDPWEKRKFKDLVVRVNKTSDDSTIPSVEFEDIISKQGRLNKDVRLKINSKQGIYFEPQDVLFGKLRPYLQNWLFPSFYGRAVGDFWVLRANSSVLSEYLFVLIQSPRFQIVANISSGTKMPRSDWNTVSNTSFPIPVQSEQRKIWQLFNVLDNLIAATQSRLSSLELLKKALLQDLFI